MCGKIGVGQLRSPPSISCAKERIAAGVRRAGWAAKVEEPYKGGITDVLAVHLQRSAVAFEVQWSSQTLHDTRIRQSRYKLAGINCVWFFKQHDFPSDALYPGFLLGFDKVTRTLTVRMPTSKYEPLEKKWRRRSYSPQEIELSAFVEGLLTGRLHLDPVQGRLFPVDLNAASSTCEKCGCHITVGTSLNFKIAKILPGFDDKYLPIYSIHKDSGIAQSMASDLQVALLRQHGVGPLIANDSHLLNSCNYCNALVYSKVVERLINMERPLLTFQMECSQETDGRDRRPSSCSWWFDEHTVLDSPSNLFDQ